MRSLRPVVLACLASAALMLGSACSGEDTSSADTSSANTSSEETADADAGADRADAETADGGDSSGSGDDGNFTKDEIVTALEAGTEADTVAFNGNTLELTYSEGSRDAPDLQPCSLAVGLSGTLDHDIALVYPDGSYTCFDENEG